jgi:hypothetical protein
MRDAMAAPLLLLVVTGFLVGGTMSSIAVLGVSVFNWPRVGTLPTVLFACYVAVYLIGGKCILRGRAPSLRAIIVSSGWFSVTVWMTFAVTGVIGELSISGFVPSGRIALAWLLVVIASGVLMANRHRALS